MANKGRWDRCDADFIHGHEVEDTEYSEERVLTWNPVTEKYEHRVPGGAGAPHAIGGDQHTASTLSELNAKLSDASLDAAGTTRPPTAHGHTPGECGADAAGSAEAVAEALGLHAAKATEVHGFDSEGKAPPQAHSHDGYMPTTAFSGLAKITVGTIAPTNPNLGDLWIDTSN